LNDAPVNGGVLLVHYGERNAPLAEALVASGARLHEICPYEWTLPEDVAPVEALIQRVLDGNIDAILFTNQVQCRHLFDIADRMQLKPRLVDHLLNDVIVGAIGPVSADVLKQAGITPDVLPAAPNMPSLIAAVADYFELTAASD
jgi:uroporphyrinogen-III synthase